MKDGKGRELLHVALILLATCLLAAAALGTVNQLTADRIAAVDKERTDEALGRVFQEVAHPQVSNLPVSQRMAQAAEQSGARIQRAYQVRSGDESVGTAVKLETSGSQGLLDIVVGVYPDGTVSGVCVVRSQETPRIGSRIVDNENGVLDQFVGKKWEKDAFVVGRDVDAITGATVTFKGVTAGVNGALAAVDAME